MTDSALEKTDEAEEPFLEKKDKDKDNAKTELEKTMKLLGVVGVVYDEKNGLVIGVGENGQPKLIDQYDAMFIVKNLTIINGAKNNYAIGDNFKQPTEEHQLDSSKVNEVKDDVEKAKQSEEIKQRIEKAKERSKEMKKEPNAMEDSLKRIFGKRPDKVKRDILSGKPSSELKEICAKIATRAALNTVRNVQITAQQISKTMGGRP